MNNEIWFAKWMLMWKWVGESCFLQGALGFEVLPPDPQIVTLASTNLGPISISRTVEVTPELKEFLRIKW